MRYLNGFKQQFKIDKTENLSDHWKSEGKHNKYWIENKIKRQNSSDGHAALSGRLDVKIWRYWINSLLYFLNVPKGGNEMQVYKV